ncbi:MAG: 2-amino-4-hydroxy-6-hydroxymethyldihydropteridine diphosphokinase, partial [Acidobacteriota bacterium]
TAESPTTLVRLLLEIEREAGRVRGPRSAVSADRALDLDLLLLGNRVSDTLAATVPHPRVHRRAFVLVPACDIAPEMLHPLLGRTLKELLERLPEAERSAVLAGRRPEPLSPPESAER